MTYLFQLSTHCNNTLVVYNISQVRSDEYFAQSTNNNIESFHLKKKSGVWICEGGYEDFQAAKVGRLIDDAYCSVLG